ncbi:hypothetical protein [Tomitella gaofuii]|uniref:hypothetical protein n=1 Tax=Tomitella gaofuii TaxID=2760083 RepID=UPI0015F94831|nr:hypothetical protein [Tomitella gaofuii]
MTQTLVELAADTVALRDHGLDGLRQVAASGGEPGDVDEVRDRLVEQHRILALADASARQLAAHSQRLTDPH